MAGPFALIDRTLTRNAKGGYPGVKPTSKHKKGVDLNDPKTLEYLRRMHPDFDDVMVSADVDYRTRCRTDAGFASKFRIPSVVEVSQTFREHSNSVDAVCWGPEPGSFISASHDATLKLWDSKRGVCTATLTGHVAGIYHCAVAGTKQHVLSCGSGQEKNLLLWRWPEKKVVSELQGQRRSVIHVAFAPDSAHAASAGQDGTVMIHDVSTGAASLRRTLHCGSCHATSFCREQSQLLLSGGADGVLHILDLRERETPKALLLPSCVANSVYYNATLSMPFAHDGWAIHTLEFADSYTVYSGGADNKLKRWDLRHITPFKPRCAAEYLGHTAPVRSLAVSEDRRFLVTGCEDGSLRLWPVDPLGDVRANILTCKAQIKDLDADVEDLERSTADRQACAKKLEASKRTLAMWRSEEEHLVREGYVPALRSLTGHVAQVSGCDWQADESGKAASILSSSWDQTVKLFNVSLGFLE